jgi:hypothetical protein
MIDREHLHPSEDQASARSEQRRTGVVASVAIGLLLLIVIVIVLYALLG